MGNYYLVHTFKCFLPFRASARASQAPTPRVFPLSLTSSTSAFALSNSMCGAICSAVLSLRPLPSREKMFLATVIILTTGGAGAVPGVVENVGEKGPAGLRGVV